MELLTPAIGLVFWTTLAFLVVLFLLRKFAWKPILKAVNDREENIRESLESAERAREEMKGLQANNEKLLQEAREERSKMLSEAKAIKEQMIADAKEQARAEANKVAEQSRAEIENMKKGAMEEMKNLAAGLALEVAEKVLRKELKDDASQQAYVAGLLKDVTPN